MSILGFDVTIGDLALAASVTSVVVVVVLLLVLNR